MARTYKRDSRGRFAGGGGKGSRSGGRKPLQRGVNRLTRDNAGRITSQGGSGATARGGRLRTASGNKRATVTARGIGKAPAGTVGRGGKVKAPARVAKPAAAVKPARRRSRAASKVDTSASAIARRRQRAMADRSSIAGGQFNMKLNTRSAIIRSAANEIYNRQRQIAKASGGRIDPAVAREAIGALRGLSGTKRQRAEQLREKARRRIVSGRRR